MIHMYTSTPYVEKREILNFYYLMGRINNIQGIFLSYRLKSENLNFLN